MMAMLTCLRVRRVLRLPAEEAKAIQCSKLLSWARARVRARDRMPFVNLESSPWKLRSKLSSKGRHSSSAYIVFFGARRRTSAQYGGH